MSQLKGGRKTSIFIAFVISSITALGLVVAHFLFEQVFGVILAVLCLVEFVIVYMFANYAIREFIIDRITPIYQIIAHHNISRQEIKESLKQEGIQGVRDDVIAWDKERSNEIQRLYDAEKYRKEFLGNVSHELKTPIFNIQGYVLTLLEGGIDDPDINHLYLEYAEKNINRLISIIEDLNAITQLESKEVIPEIERFDIIKLIHEMLETAQLKANQRNIKLQFKNSAESIFVMADRKKISQVLINLLVNSISYGKDNGLTQVSVIETPDDRILVNITDNGLGIENKDLVRIFERFYRVDKHRSRDAGGSGLGLAIVKHIIEAHNQNLHVQSKVGIGTTFSFTLNKAKNKY